MVGHEGPTSRRAGVHTGRVPAPDRDVFIGRLFDGNHRPRRWKILSDYEAVDNVDEMTGRLRRFPVGRPVTAGIPREQTVSRINDEVDFSPEHYLPNESVAVDPNQPRRRTRRTVPLLSATAKDNGIAAQRDIPNETFTQWARSSAKG